MKFCFIPLLLLPLFSNAQANTDSLFIKKMSDEIMTNGKAYDLLHELTKKIGGRLAGSPQARNAVIWGKKSLESMGADKVFLQPCKVPNWKRGGNDFVAITGVNGEARLQPLSALALGNSMGSNGLIEAEVVAVSSFEELEKRKEEVKGKIVYYHSVRRSGASIAAKYGAVAVLIHSLSTAPDNEPHTGVMVYDEAYPKIPAVALGPNDAKMLYALAQKGTIKAQVQTYGFFLPDADDNNVIAEIRGSEFPDQYITLGGHLDSWDVNEGAHDDGAGIVHTMEVLRVMKALNYKPKRTIRFVLFANEENAARGGKEYANQAKINKENHIFVIESDEGGFTPRSIGITAPPAQFARFQTWTPLLKPYGSEITFGGGGTDIAPMAGINKESILAGLIPDSQRYFDLHHAKTDVFENVNKRELHLGAVNMAAIIYLIDKYGTN
jgi:hypothetical protein